MAISQICLKLKRNWHPKFTIHNSRPLRPFFGEYQPRKIPSCVPEGTAPRRHSRMNLTARQFTPAIDGAIPHPDSTLYQLQPSFHTQSTEPRPTARARRAGKGFYQTTPEFMFVSILLLVVDSMLPAWTSASAIMYSVKAARNDESATSRRWLKGARS